MVHRLAKLERTKEKIQMITGAVTLLDKLSIQDSIVNVTISIEKKSLGGFQNHKRIIQTPPNG